MNLNKISQRFLNLFQEIYPHQLIKPLESAQQSTCNIIDQNLKKNLFCPETSAIRPESSTARRRVGSPAKRGISTESPLARTGKMLHSNMCLRAILSYKYKNFLMDKMLKIKLFAKLVSLRENASPVVAVDVDSVLLAEHKMPQ